jgi:hypothetical protein
VANRKSDLAIERRIRIKISGIQAKFIDCGNIANDKRNPDEVRNTILNQIVYSFFIKRVKNATTKRGLSQMIFRFIFIA